MTAYRLGVDIGGTFTDIVILAPDGTIYSKKVSSTPDDYSRAIEDGLVQYPCVRPARSRMIPRWEEATTAHRAKRRRQGS